MLYDYSIYIIEMDTIRNNKNIREIPLMYLVVLITTKQKGYQFQGYCIILQSYQGSYITGHGIVVYLCHLIEAATSYIYIQTAILVRPGESHPISAQSFRSCDNRHQQLWHGIDTLAEDSIILVIIASLIQLP